MRKEDGDRVEVDKRVLPESGAAGGIPDRAEESQSVGARKPQVDDWHSQQPDRCCVACGALKPATEFGFTYFQADGQPRLHQRCKCCHQNMRERGYPLCSLCARKLAEGSFIWTFQGYRLYGGGVRFYVSCSSCERAFLALPEAEQRQIIRAACDRIFPVGQVIYTLSDIETGLVRYIGRTGKPTERYKQRRHGGRAKDEQGRKRPMTIVKVIEIGPLVSEWEYRYIAHGVQQGWNLLNLEGQDERFVAKVRTAQVNFLQAPFDELVKLSLFVPNGLEAFVRAWYDVADNESLEADLHEAE